MVLLPNCLRILTIYDKVYERIRSDIITAVFVGVVNPHFWANAAPQHTKCLATKGAELQATEARRRAGYGGAQQWHQLSRKGRHRPTSGITAPSLCGKISQITCNATLALPPLTHPSWINATPFSSAFEEQRLFLCERTDCVTLFITYRAVSAESHWFRDHLVWRFTQIGGRSQVFCCLGSGSACPLSDIFFQSLGPSSHAAAVPPDTQAKQEKNNAQTKKCHQPRFTHPCICSHSRVSTASRRKLLTPG